MSFDAFVRAFDIDRIAFGECDWVDMKRELTSRDFEEIARGAMKFRAGPGKAPAIQLRSTAPQTILRMMLKQAIVAWSFGDGDGNPVPITLASLASLKGSVFNRLLQELSARNPQIEEAGARMLYGGR